MRITLRFLLDSSSRAAPTLSGAVVETLKQTAAALAFLKEPYCRLHYIQIFNVRAGYTSAEDPWHTLHHDDVTLLMEPGDPPRAWEELAKAYKIHWIS